jgi:hypothetical protein
VLLKKKPPLSDIGPERKLIIIGCTGLKMLLEHLDLIDCFNIPLHVPNIKLDTEVSCVLNRYKAKPDEVKAIASDYQAIHGNSSGIPIRKLLLTMKLAKEQSGSGHLTYESFCDSYKRITE